MSICLAMIVKNEAKVIERCLASVRPIISTWCIVDTGSTDGTQEIVRKYLHDLPGELVERLWVDYGTNKSEMLALAQGKADYTLVMDADDVLEISSTYTGPNGCDMYDVDIVDGSLNYQREQLFKAALPWRYVGVAHAYPTCGRPVQHAKLEGVLYRRLHDGASWADPAKHAKKAALLLRAHKAFPEDARTVFYLAQEYRDAKQLQEAIKWYLIRAKMKGWAEETWYALYQAGMLMLTVGDKAGVATLFSAYNSDPVRVEPLYRLARYFRSLKQYSASYVVAKIGKDVPYPKDRALFVEKDVYDWCMLDEFSLGAWWTGHRLEAQAAFELLLEKPVLPAKARERVKKNAAFGTDPNAAWALNPSIHQWIRDHFQQGQKIVEFGSGAGSERLAQYFDVYSVEHDSAYIDKYKTKYVYAPIKDGWYDTDKVRELLTAVPDYVLVIVDGPPADVGRRGFLKHVNLFGKVPILFDDVNRAHERTLAEDVAKAVGGRLEILDTSDTRKFAVVYP